MDRDTYDKLCKAAQNKDYKYWYDVSHDVFLAQPLESEEDFVRIVAFAYSWMPTIPDWNEGFDWANCFPMLQALKTGQLEVRLRLLEHLVPVINNSIVGTSKVLYFISPHNTPMIDSNVVAAWRTLFFPHGLPQGRSTVAPLPSNFGTYGNDVQVRSRHIRLYLQYWDNMLAWSTTLGDSVTLRDLESLLYLYPKKPKRA